MSDTVTMKGDVLQAYVMARHREMQLQDTVAEAEVALEEAKEEMLCAECRTEDLLMHIQFEEDND